MGMGTQDIHVRRADDRDRNHMLGLWERSVRATHEFLTEGEILALQPHVAKLFDGSLDNFWVAVREADVLLGFLGYAHDSVDALFIDPDHRGCGVGTLLMLQAQQLSGGSLIVEVNEQNDGALGFYKAQGFRVVSRSPLDAEGRPYPLLHMRRPAPPTR